MGYKRQSVLVGKWQMYEAIYFFKNTIKSLLSIGQTPGQTLQKNATCTLRNMVAVLINYIC